MGESLNRNKISVEAQSIAFKYLAITKGKIISLQWRVLAGTFFLRDQCHYRQIQDLVTSCTDRIRREGDIMYVALP
jgi:hypothetical protein